MCACVGLAGATRGNSPGGSKSLGIPMSLKGKIHFESRNTISSPMLLVFRMVKIAVVAGVAATCQNAM